MSNEHIDKLFQYIRERHLRSLRGIEEARAVAPDQFERIARMYLNWLVLALGEGGIESAADAFVQFTTSVNLAQARYEASGSYQHKSFAEVYADHYSQKEMMEEYLWGIYLTNFLWAHHLEICLFFRDRFLPKVAETADLLEIAPGHGGWGIWALDVHRRARLTGFDISPSSIEIARRISTAAGFKDRAVYQEKNALDLNTVAKESADGVICSFLVEHLDQPQRLFAVISHLLKPRCLAFITGALTAAQVDHIYEFRYESELVKMCEDHGLRVLETLSANPRRILPKARFMPRSMALLVQKRVNDCY